MNLTALDNVLWAAGFIGHAALLVVLLYRGRWRQFPVFTSLIGYHIVVSILLFAVSHHESRHTYAVTYWTTSGIDALFQLALIFEIARVVLRPTGTWVRDARTSFLIAGTTGAAVALGLCLTLKPLAHSTLGVWEIRVDLFTALLDCEMFAAMLWASNRLGLEWRNHVMGLAQGITVWAFAAVASDMARIIFGWKGQFVIFDHLLLFLYVGVLVYWMFTFWREEPARAPLSEKMQDYLVALHSRVQYDLTRVTKSNLHE